jgi:hypothetical protein
MALRRYPQIVGHRTEAGFSQVSYAGEKMLVEAADKPDQFHALDRRKKL